MSRVSSLIVLLFIILLQLNRINRPLVAFKHSQSDALFVRNILDKKIPTKFDEEQKQSYKESKYSYCPQMAKKIS